MTRYQRRMLVVATMSYIGGLVGLAVTRSLGWDPWAQLLAGYAGVIAVWIAAVLVDERNAGQTRNRSLIANFVVQASAIFLTLMLMNLSPVDYPVYIIVLEVPLYLAVFVGVNWRALARYDEAQAS